MARASLVPASLRYLHQVARSGSIQKAAKELNVAASAIDRQILLLERELDVELFERLPRGMRLTAAGDALVTLARRWRDDERRVAADIKQLQGVDQGHVRLVAMDSHANGFLPRFIERMAIEQPRISLEVEIASPDDALTALLAGNGDIAAIFNLSPRRDVHVHWSAELPFGCIVAPTHALARHETVSLQEVVAHPIALQSKALMIRRYLDARYSWLFADPQKALVTNSLQLVKQLARGGRYVAFTSELDAAPELTAGSLKFLPVRDKGAEPQTVSIAADARKPLSRIGRIVANLLADEIRASLNKAREPAQGTPPPAVSG
ncbi:MULTISPECIES: LysR family transcriptional regulator [unclassified Chelatococcus]|uniref:LysR family transcriptional regulator n=1 Tax=unclassified Chelatococcus TaxID=2638111 RepID=UPI001BD17242|nr:MULTISPECIES: LysR family transcriptional regulator [unclassified Chelatococcus]CAH1670543.1 LysR family transcriptional regulator [Hyphomicrobiales bacterium]MBS7739190.1 LysR family transcriptional regulator [Chelatococcus sp. HY11]MBX3543680.1 LysR family transcriptional regulator [Chelatococcus sp.]MCO5076277.1 LysR family transcriptional regulator [Chelatococcus sp.]CAH1677265.1 LysR family transcriptional regulator [Hyphomicrobiales bacterium]